MKDKRGRGIKIVISLVIIVAIIHGISHIILFGTNLSLIQTIGLSGRAIGESNFDSIELSIKQSEKVPLPSMLVIIAEWVLVFSLIALTTIRKHLAESMQKATHIELVKKKNKSDTDIDLLYEMLKKNKRISLSKLAELFKVDKKVVEEWGKILEENGYAVVDYPRFGEIEIRIKEDEEAQKA